MEIGGYNLEWMLGILNLIDFVKLGTKLNIFVIFEFIWIKIIP